MVVLIDSDVLMDYLAKREPFYSNACKIIELRKKQRYYGYITTQTFANLHYILRHTISEQQRRDLLHELCVLFNISVIEGFMVVRALKEPQYKDFEDRLQMLCAIKENAEFVVTRNLKDYTDSEVKAIPPEEFLRLIESE